MLEIAIANTAIFCVLAFYIIIGLVVLISNFLYKNIYRLEVRRWIKKYKIKEKITKIKQYDKIYILNFISFREEGIIIEMLYSLGTNRYYIKNRKNFKEFKESIQKIVNYKEELE